MRVMSLIRIWFALMVCIIFCVGFFLTLKYSTISKAEKKLFHTNFCIQNKATSLIPMQQILKKKL